MSNPRTKQMTDDFLAHWGVKGMKWGVRKDGKPQGYQGKKISGVVATRTMDTNFNLSPGMNVVDGGGGTKTPQEVSKENRYLAERTRENAKKALASPELHKNIRAVNEKYFGSKGSPKAPKNALEKGEYYAAYVRALNEEFSKYSDMSTSMISQIEPIMDKNLDLVGFEYLYGDQAYVDQIVRHADTEPRGFRQRIDAIVNSKTGMIEGLKMKGSISHSDLAHYGVKGMKWGVRKDRKGNVRARATLSRREHKTLTEFSDPMSGKTVKFEKAFNKTYSRAAGKIRKGIRTINKSEKYKGKDFRSDSPLRREYYNDLSKMMTQQLNASAAKTRMGRFQMKFNIDVSKASLPTVTLVRREHRKGRKAESTQAKVDLKHSENYESEDRLEVQVLYDAQGYVLGLDLDEEVDDLEHADVSQITEDFLAHYGVKGMKWGVRKDGKPQGHQGSNGRQVASDFGRVDSGKSIKMRPNMNKTKVQVRPDISNDELRRINERLRLEIEFNRSTKDLAKQNRSRSHKIAAGVGEVFVNAAKKSATQLLAAKATQVGANVLKIQVPKDKKDDDKKAKK